MTCCHAIASFERLDGSTRGDLRQASIDRYSKAGSDRFVFLICTRAGGVGINLTAADTVVIYDSGMTRVDMRRSCTHGWVAAHAVLMHMYASCCPCYLQTGIHRTIFKPLHVSKAFGVGRRCAVLCVMCI